MPVQENAEAVKTPIGLGERIASALKSYPTLTLFLSVIAVFLLTINFLLIKTPSKAGPVSVPEKTARESKEAPPPVRETTEKPGNFEFISGTFLSFDEKNQTLEIFTGEISKVALTSQTKFFGVQKEDLSKTLPGSQILIGLKPDSKTQIAEEVSIIPYKPVPPPKDQPGGPQT